MNNIKLRVELHNLLEFAEKHGENIKKFLTELKESKKEIEIIMSCSLRTDKMIERLDFLINNASNDFITNKINEINSTSKMIDEKLKQLSGASAECGEIIKKAQAGKNFVQYL